MILLSKFKPIRFRLPACGALLALLLGVGCGEEPDPLRGVILIAIDTLRADRVGAYGAARPTPALDGLAEQGVLFENTISYGARTRPSFAATLSGRFPTRRDFDRVLLRSLVSRLKNGGFQTVAFTEGGELSRIYGFDRGFDYWWEQETPVTARDSLSPGIDRTFSMAQDWLRDAAGDQRFFLFLHTYEVHLPYRRLEYAKAIPRGDFPVTFETGDVGRLAAGELEAGVTERNYVNALYDGGVAMADRHVGNLLEVLEETGRRENTLIVVLSDHGEELGERLSHYLGGHGHTLYDELLRVPLIIHDPLRTYPEKRVRAQVRSIDVLPTILDRVGLTLPADSHGKSLLPVMEGRMRSDRMALSQTFKNGVKLRSAVRAKSRKLVRNSPRAEPVLPRTQAFDLRVDPGEESNEIHENPTWVGEFQVFLDNHETLERREGVPHFGSPKDMPAELKERLRSLGYVE